jgi:hypothetical protein
MLVQNLTDGIEEHGLPFDNARAWPSGMQARSHVQ